MNQNCAVIENLHAVQVKDLLSTLGIDSLCCVQDEGEVGRRVVEVMDEVRIHLQRVSPAKSREDANGEVVRQELARKRIVMTDRSDTAEQIANSSPP